MEADRKPPQLTISTLSQICDAQTDDERQKLPDQFESKPTNQKVVFQKEPITTSKLPAWVRTFQIRLMNSDETIATNLIVMINQKYFYVLKKINLWWTPFYLSKAQKEK